VAGDDVVVGVAAAGGLADLGVPGELGVEAVKAPEAVRAEREAPRRARTAPSFGTRAPAATGRGGQVLHQLSYWLFDNFHQSLHPNRF
jgi:hypothetical protein